MGREGPRSAWLCPSCARHVPRNVDVCRCGSERRTLEELGFRFDQAQPEGPDGTPQRPHVERHGLFENLIGYQIDTDLGAGWRATAKGLFAVAVVAVAVAMARYTHTDPAPVRNNITVLTTLQDYTRRAEGAVGNAIPSFLASAGSVGMLAPAGTSTDPVMAIDEAELRKGLCSPSVAVLVRHEYPGFYDDWPDDELEESVLEKHPDYSDRFCMLSSQVDAGPGEVIKYELRPRSPLSWTGLWLRTLLVTVAFAVVCLNVYYRGIIGRRDLRRGDGDDAASHAGRHAA